MKCILLSRRHKRPKCYMLSGHVLKVRTNPAKPYNKYLIYLVCSVCSKYCLRFLRHGPRTRLISPSYSSDATKNVAQSTNYEIEQKKANLGKTPERFSVLNAFCRKYATWKNIFAYCIASIA